MAGFYKPSYYLAQFRFEEESIDDHLHNPEGGVHGCTPFSDRGRMPSRKISIISTPASGALAKEAISFGYFSLGQQRKVTRCAAVECSGF